MFEEDYHVCIVDCPAADFTCHGICACDYQQNIEQCPCQAGCPDGCPCPIYQCSMTTSSPSMTTIKPTTSPRTSVLVLNTFYESNVPAITNVDGKDERAITDFMFMFDKSTEVFFSCSLTWRGEFIIFGGDDETKQVAKLNKCKLERIGTLDFEHKRGACANANDDSIYLCFNTAYDDSRRCRVAVDPIGQYGEVTPSIFEHRHIRLASSPGKQLNDDLF